MKRIPDCPYCGSGSGVVRNVRVYGWAEQWFYANGVTETSFDKLNNTDTKLLRCPDCYRVRRDVQLVEGIIERAER